MPKPYMTVKHIGSVAYAEISFTWAGLVNKAFPQVRRLRVAMIARGFIKSKVATGHAAADCGDDSLEWFEAL